MSVWNVVLFASKPSRLLLPELEVDLTQPSFGADCMQTGTCPHEHRFVRNSSNHYRPSVSRLTEGTGRCLLRAIAVCAIVIACPARRLTSSLTAVSVLSETSNVSAGGQPEQLVDLGAF